MRVFFDASVIIAGLLSPIGGSALFLRYNKKHNITGITSETVLEEIFGEDKQKKIDRTREEIQQFIADLGLVVRQAISLQEIQPYNGKIAEEDAHLIAGATLTKCEYLVSLDKKHVLNEEIRT